MDALFDGAAGEDRAEDPPEEADPAPSAPLSLLRPGFALSFSSAASLGFSPGLSEAPWFHAEHGPAYSHIFGAKLSATLGLDVQFSETLRAKSSFLWEVPGGGISLSEFFLDYSIRGRVFFRLGKFGYNWGISPNFPSANLLSRIPAGNTGGDPYIFKADVPVGIGGLEFLAMTRPGFMKGATPGFSEIGYGMKYNLAFPGADIDAAVFFHRQMPLRASLAVKTTVGDTELYLETMNALRHESWDGFSVSGNAGFVKGFLNDVFVLNGELFWNGEEDAHWFKPRTNLEEEESSPFIPGLNGALNLAVRPGWRGGLSFYVRGLWALTHNTFHVTPGLRFAPFPRMVVSLGFPAALGGRDGYYYRHNPDAGDRPFSAVLLVTLNGSYRYARYD